MCPCFSYCPGSSKVAVLSVLLNTETVSSTSFLPYFKDSRGRSNGSEVKVGPLWCKGSQRSSNNVERIVLRLVPSDGPMEFLGALAAHRR